MAHEVTAHQARPGVRNTPMVGMSKRILVSIPERALSHFVNASG
jgi:hypothetical protein